MPTTTLSDKERSRRKRMIESLLQQGFGPQGKQNPGRLKVTSATKEAERRDGVNYARWARREEEFRDAGKTHYAVDWSLHQPRVSVAPATAGSVDEIPDVSAQDHAETRAEALASAITHLVTGSRYPLINPEAILVEPHTMQVYDPDEKGLVDVPARPRTWVTDTLRVAPIKDARGRKFLFTGAQNDTPVHDPFWNNLQAYAADIGADIVVGPWTYETQWWSENNPTSRNYDEAITDHLCFGQMKIGSNFAFIGEMNTLPTASQPISDLVTYPRGRWAVFPHAKRQLKSVPSTDPSVQAHQVMTSGACTRPKVIPRKAGIKSIFHHIIGAVLVEFDHDGDVFCRHITADENTGAFYDLDAYVVDETVIRGQHRARSVVFPDVHAAKLGPVNGLALFGVEPNGDYFRRMLHGKSVLDVLRPEFAFYHDVFDMESRNHHHAKDNSHSYRQAIRGRESVMGELSRSGSFLIGVERSGIQTVVVESNHDIALERYVLEGRYRLDGINVRLGLRLEDAYMGWQERVAEALDGFLSPPKFSLFETAVREIYRDHKEGIQAQWAYDGQSFKVDGIEHGHHGFRGANGAKGTITGFARMGAKMTIGDKHSPEILDGVYVAGAAELQHGYNKGPSGWAVSFVVQYPDGKRALVTLQNGKWRADNSLLERTQIDSQFA
jgi:hypothetical protein